MGYRAPCIYNAFYTAGFIILLNVYCDFCSHKDYILKFINKANEKNRLSADFIVNIPTHKTQFHFAYFV